MHAWTLYVSYWRQVTAAMKGVVRRKVRSNLSHGLSHWLQNTLMMGQLELMGAEEDEKAKRYEVVVKRFRAKMNNKGLFMCYAGWQAFVARMKWERVTLARFAKKISMRKASSSFLSWLAFVLERKRIKQLLFRIFSRLENSFVLKGFNPSQRIADRLR